MLLDTSTDCTNNLGLNTYHSATGYSSEAQQPLVAPLPSVAAGDDNQPNDFFNPDCVARLNMIMSMVDAAGEF